MDGVKPPFTGDALEFMVSPIVESDAGAGDEVFHCSGDENLSGLCECCDSRTRVNGDSGEFRGLALTLAGV